MVSWSDPHEDARLGAKLSGFEHLHAIVAGVLSPGPMATMLGFQFVEIDPGRVLVVR